MTISSYFENFPMTSGLLIINFLLFILNHLGFAEYTISYPQIISSGTFLAHFSHVQILHLIMNMVILYRMGPLLETHLHPDGMLNLFLGLWFGLVIFLYFFQTTPLLGFSGIIMGFLSFLMLLSRRMNREFSQSILIMLILNILIGLMPGISFMGHFGGAIVGVILFLIYRIASPRSFL